MTFDPPSGGSYASDMPEAVQRAILASEGRRFTDRVIDQAANLVVSGGYVRVLTIARMWGTGLGIPHPGLRPNKSEMAEHEDNIAQAIRRLKRAGLKAEGHIIATRKPGKSIIAEAQRERCEVIVMGADPRRRWVIRDFMWSQEPYRVRRRSSIPTHLVCTEAASNVG